MAHISTRHFPRDNQYQEVRNIRRKKTKTGRKASKKSSKAKLTRPQRVAARNAVNMFSKIPETFSCGEEDDILEADASESESLSQDSITQVDEPDWEHLNRVDQGVGKAPFEESTTVTEPVDIPEAKTSVGNRGKLVLKLSIRDPKKSLLLENTIKNCNGKDKFEASSSIPCALEDKDNTSGDDGVRLYHPLSTNQKPSQSVNKVTIKCKGLLERTPDHTISSVDDVGSPDKLSTGDGIPVEGSCGRYVRKGTSGDGDFHVVEDTVVTTNDFSSGLKECAQPVPIRIKIKSSRMLKQEETPEVQLVNGVKNPAACGDCSLPKAYMADYGSGMDEDICNMSFDDCSPGADFPDAETDFVRRARSMEMKASTCDSDRGNHKLKLRKGDRAVGTSRISEGPSSEWTSNGNVTARSRSTRSRQDNFFPEDRGSPDTSQSNFTGRKISWLMLSEHEPGYRYIPQLGDQVVYLVQGHKEFVETSGSYERGPWVSTKGRLNAVEICLVESLDYATAPGSGESCCKLSLKFIDPFPTCVASHSG